MPNSSKGFTLLEVMIAMAILAIALVAVFSSQTQSISMSGNARFTTTATLLAQSKMVEYEAMAPGNVRSGNGNFGDDFPDYVWQAEVSDTDRDLLRKIEVTVSNQRLGKNNSYRLSLYRVIAE